MLSIAAAAAIGGLLLVWGVIRRHRRRRAPNPHGTVSRGWLSDNNDYPRSGY